MYATPAGGITASVGDMVRLFQFLLARGVQMPSNTFQSPR